MPQAFACILVDCIELIRTDHFIRHNKYWEGDRLRENLELEYISYDILIDSHKFTL